MSRNLKCNNFEPQFVLFNIFAFAKLRVSFKIFLYAHIMMCEECTKNGVKINLIFFTFFILNCLNSALSCGIKHYIDTDSKLKILNEIKKCSVQDNAWVRN